MKKQISLLLVFVVLAISLTSCKKDKNTKIQVSAGSPVTDIDGNIYQTEKIGTQVWMTQNLKTAHFRDGSPIPELEDTLTLAWQNLTTPAWCYYGSDSANNATYGKLYNWYAVEDARNICPTGYHIPTDSEWTVLSNYLGGDAVSGGHLKSTGSLWASPNTGADNSSGFAALPAGYRVAVGYSYYDISIAGYFWTTTQDINNNGVPLNIILGNSYSFCNRSNDYGAPSGFSVRCVKD